MLVTADARDILATATDLLVIPVTSVGDKKRTPGRLAGLDRLLGGGIHAAIASGDFRGERDQKLVLYPNGALPAERILLLGLGKENRVDAEALRRVGGTAVREGTARKAKKVTVAAAPSRRLRADAVGQALAEGAVAPTTGPGDDIPDVKAVTVLVVHDVGDSSGVVAALALDHEGGLGDLVGMVGGRDIFEEAPHPGRGEPRAHAVEARGELELPDAVALAREAGVVFEVLHIEDAVLDLSSRADVSAVKKYLMGRTVRL